MQKSLIKRLISPSFCLSLLLHLLLLLSVSTIVFFQPEVEKKPTLYVPSYVYRSSSPASFTQVKRLQSKSETTSSQKDDLPKTQHAQRQNVTKVDRQIKQQRSILSLTNNMLQQNQQAMISSLKQTEEPIYLVGDKNDSPDPLVRLLGRALSAHFEYPHDAGVFGIRGRTVIGMILFPDGGLSDVQVLESSENQDLDAAALYAVNSAPRIQGANKYISQPKHFIVGFIFR